MLPQQHVPLLASHTHFIRDPFEKLAHRGPWNACTKILSHLRSVEHGNTW